MLLVVLQTRHISGLQRYGGVCTYRAKYADQVTAQSCINSYPPSVGVVAKVEAVELSETSVSSRQTCIGRH